MLETTTLTSKSVILAPLGVEHKDALLDAASDGNLWELWFTSVPNKATINNYIEQALAQQGKGLSLPFVVIEKHTQKIIGTTRFCNADKVNRRLEIGFTWYAKSYQRTSVNTECKLLLLTHAFEHLNVIAVEFRTHWHNLKSRNAIARLGAKQDGVLRNHQKMADGSYRDTVVFSITNTEWLAVKNNLMLKLNN
ncbi:GNAT family N-acetyltransferase [Thalassotalea montiporae]